MTFENICIGGVPHSLIMVGLKEDGAEQWADKDQVVLRTELRRDTSYFDATRDRENSFGPGPARRLRCTFVLVSE